MVKQWASDGSLKALIQPFRFTNSNQVPTKVDENLPILIIMYQQTLHNTSAVEINEAQGREIGTMSISLSFLN